MMPFSLRELKARAEGWLGHDSLNWQDSPYYGGSSIADCEYGVLSVMVEPPKGQPPVALVRGRETVAIFRVANDS